MTSELSTDLGQETPAGRIGGLIGGGTGSTANNGSRGKCGRCKLVRGPSYNGHKASKCPWKSAELLPGKTPSTKAVALNRVWQTVQADFRGAITPAARRRLLEATDYELRLTDPKGGFVKQLLFHQRTDLRLVMKRLLVMFTPCYS